jgi:hypothetical protein
MILFLFPEVLSSVPPSSVIRPVSRFCLLVNPDDATFSDIAQRLPEIAGVTDCGAIANPGGCAKVVDLSDAPYVLNGIRREFKDFNCDTCDKNVEPSVEVSWGCRQCDRDICAGCLKKSIKKLDGSISVGGFFPMPRVSFVVIIVGHG